MSCFNMSKKTEGSLKKNFKTLKISTLKSIP